MMATYGLAKEGIGKVKGGIDKVKKITGTGSATERMDNKIAKEAAKQAKIVAKDAADARHEEAVEYLRKDGEFYQKMLDKMSIMSEKVEVATEQKAETSTTEQPQSSETKSKAVPTITAGSSIGKSPDSSSVKPTEGGVVLNTDEAMPVTNEALNELLEGQKELLAIDARRDKREIKAERRALEDRRDKKGLGLPKKNGAPLLNKKAAGGLFSTIASGLASVLSGPIGKIGLAVAGMATGLTALKMMLNKIPGVNLKVDDPDKKGPKKTVPKPKPGADKSLLKAAEEQKIKNAKKAEIKKANALKKFHAIEAAAEKKRLALKPNKVSGVVKGVGINGPAGGSKPGIAIDKSKITVGRAPNGQFTPLKQPVTPKISTTPKIFSNPPGTPRNINTTPPKMPVFKNPLGSPGNINTTPPVKPNKIFSNPKGTPRNINTSRVPPVKPNKIFSRNINTSRVPPVPSAARVPPVPRTPINAMTLAPKGNMLPNFSNTRIANSKVGTKTAEITAKAVTKLAENTPTIIKTTAQTALKTASVIATKAAVPLTIIASGYEAFTTENDDTLNRDEKNAKHVGTGGGLATATAMGMAGAAVGSVVPVVGTLIGGLTGAAIGYFMGKYGGEKLGEELFLDGKEIGDPTLEASASEGGKGGETKEEMDMVLAKQAQDSGAVDIGWGDADIDDLEKLKDLTTEQVQALLDVETWSKADEEMLKKVLDAKKNGLTITHDDGGWLGKESLEFEKGSDTAENAAKLSPVKHLNADGTPYVEPNTLAAQTKRAEGMPENNLELSSGFSERKFSQEDPESYKKFRAYMKENKSARREENEASGKKGKRYRRTEEMFAKADAIKLFAKEIALANAATFRDKRTKIEYTPEKDVDLSNVSGVKPPSQTPTNPNMMGLTAQEFEEITPDVDAQDAFYSAGNNPGSIYTHDMHLEKILNGDGDKDSIFKLKTLRPNSLPPLSNSNLAPEITPVAGSNLTPVAAGDAQANVGADKLKEDTVTPAMSAAKNGSAGGGGTTVINNTTDNSQRNSSVNNQNSTAHAPSSPPGIGHMGVTTPRG